MTRIDMTEVKAAAEVFAAVDAAFSTVSADAHPAVTMMRSATMEAAGAAMIRMIGMLALSAADRDRLADRADAGFPHPVFGMQGYAKTCGAICDIMFRRGPMAGVNIRPEVAEIAVLEILFGDA